MFWKKTTPEVKSTLEVLQERSGNAVNMKDKLDIYLARKRGDQK